MKFIDGFIFYNELELLKARFEELYDIVDYFILVEGTLTFTGIAKPLYYNENKEQFAKYNDKVIHIIVDDFPSTTNPWDREFHQRNCIKRGVSKLLLAEDDRIIISDVDEIVSNELVYNIKYGIRRYNSNVYSLEMKLYYYNLEWTVERKWDAAKLVTSKFLNTCSPQDIRMLHRAEKIQNCGWHITYFGDISFITKKLSSFSEASYYTKDNSSPEFLTSCISDGTIHFNKEKLIKIPHETNTLLPYYFLKNKIPKRLICFWEGSQLSMLQYYTLYSFRKLNPTFDIIMYYSSKKENFVHGGSGENTVHPGSNYSTEKYISLDTIKSIPNITITEIDVEKDYNIKFNISPIHKADIIRIMKLYEEGGIWIDLDVLCVKSIPPSIIRHNGLQYFTYLNTVPTGLLITPPRNNLMEIIKNTCVAQIEHPNIQNNWQYYGPDLWKRCILNNPLFKDCPIINTLSVYPYLVEDSEKFFFTNEDKILPITFCIHWYNGHKKNRKYIEQFDPSDIKSDRCVFEKYLSMLIAL